MRSSHRSGSARRSAPVRTPALTLGGLVLKAVLLSSVAVWLAWHHPLSAGLALATVVAAVGVAAWRPLAMLLLVPALIPVLSFAPWTGWMLVEEWDLLLLALLAGVWIGIAWRDRASTEAPERRHRSSAAAAGWWLLAGAYAVATAVSVQRGLTDAGAWPPTFGPGAWWQGWREPMNTLRLAKALAGAMLAWSAWQALQLRWPNQAAGWLRSGVIAGLTLVCLVLLWERYTWTGLSNFSTDYRTTALFWETHVGGAALDAYLALTLPFAVHALLSARRRRTWLVLMAVLMLAGYAVLTTFSRGLYLGVVASLLIWALLQWRSAAPGLGGGGGAGRRIGSGLFWLAVFALGAWFMFAAGGYRALLAWWGLLTLALAGWGCAGRTPAPRGPMGGIVTMTLLGALLGAALTAAALSLPTAVKAPYLLYGGLWLLGMGVATLQVRWPRANAVLPWVSLWAALAPAAIGVAWHWGQGEVRWLAAPVVLIAALVMGLGAASPVVRGPPGLRWRAVVAAAMGFAALVVGSLAGGKYLEGRFSTAGEDWQGRMLHWSRSADLLSTSADTLWGKGVGRFPANFALSGQTTDQTGDYRWLPAESGGTLVLTAGKHTLGFGELFRISQRIDAVGNGPLIVRWRTRTDAPASLHVEVCEKHLLYDGACRVMNVALQDTGESVPQGDWRTGQVCPPGAGDDTIAGVLGGRRQSSRTAGDRRSQRHRRSRARSPAQRGLRRRHGILVAVERPPPHAMACQESLASSVCRARSDRCCRVRGAAWFGVEAVRFEPFGRFADRSADCGRHRGAVDGRAV